MAKKRRVKSSRGKLKQGGSPQSSTGTSNVAASQAPVGGDATGDTARSDSRVTQTRSAEPLAIASALLSGGLVYTTYHTSDSVAVERGDALWFAVIAIVVATLTFARCAWQGQLMPWQFNPSEVPEDSSLDRAMRTSLAIDVFAVSLTGWVAIASLSTSPPGNLRMGTNEAWLWISGAAVFCAARRLMNSLAARRAVVTLVIIAGFGTSVHGLHQHWVSLPKSRADYRADPDKLLREAQITAPPGSAERMVFENRLFDGGPTGTFALANSLAGLLVLGCVLGAAFTVCRWSSMNAVQRVSWVAILVVILSCLLAARSRSATAACVIGMILSVIGGRLFASSDDSNEDELVRVSDSKKTNWRRLVFVGSAMLVAAGLGVVSLIAAVGNKEWFEQAPASITFRFQYWRSTWRMALDNPLFGAGPGNFQSLYQRYREPSANEEIADAHNFLFETLAAGGFVALFFLVGLFAAIASFCYLHMAGSSIEREKQREDATEDRAKWVWLGSGLSLLLIWLIGAAAGQTPDFQAHKYAVPLACTAALLIWPSMRSCSAAAIDTAAVTASGALLIHLLAAGGWTVPGVATPLWLLAACVTRTSSTAVSTAATNTPSARQSRWLAGTIVLAGVLLLIVHRTYSLTPVESAARAIRVADLARAERQLAAMHQAIDRAVDADPWSPEASLYKSDLLHWEVIYRGDSETTRDRWLEMVNQALERAGENPTIYRAASQQSLHLYQRFGNDDYLSIAHQWLSLASEWSPADHAMKAQLSALVACRGDLELARKLAHEAAAMANLGENIERDLTRQMIYVVESIGRAAENGPKILPASKVLANWLPANQTDADRVPSQK